MIFTYHKIGSQVELGITTVSRRRFADHLDLFNEIGRKPALASEHCGGSQGALEVSGGRSVALECVAPSTSCLALTFDDGYQSVYTQAFPEMASRGWTATIFIVVGSVGGTNTWDVRLSPRSFKHLSWKQIADLSRAGFEIGSHTLSHRDLTRLDAASLRKELRDSKRIIEDRLGRAVTSVSYPFGRHTRRVNEEAGSAGYQCGFTSFPNDGIDKMAMGRISVYAIDGRSSLERKLGLRRGYRLECIKNTLIAKLSLGTTLVKR
jgi:peptidoglycan/xylan/chitin deacetylase (PgdA/CDA1 family)